MALLPYKSHQSPLNRSRSSSCSSTIRNRIVYHEILSVGANTLIRSYSCDQIFDKDESGQPFQTTKIQVSSFITPEKNRHTFKEVQTTPKRLDLPAKEPVMTKKQLKMIASETKTRTNTKRDKTRTMRKFLKFALVPIICSCFFYFFSISKECNYKWDIEKTVNELVGNVLGQSDAIFKIDSALRMCNASEDVFTMVFTGGVGVGKTYSSSIISHNFPWSFNKLLYYCESFQTNLNNLLKFDLLPCGCNLLIVDNLSTKNSDDAIEVVKLFQEKRKNKEKLLIILIFQIHDEAERLNILTQFKKTYVPFYHVPFQTLSKDVIQECFNREIKRQNVKISKQKLDKLIRDKMSYIDILKGPTGCKGVSDEVSSFYKKYTD